MLAFFAVLVAFLSATQDIAFDAYSTDVLRKSELAAGAAVKVLGYRLAMIVSGGLALVLAGEWLGWASTYFLMGAFMALCDIATYRSEEHTSELQSLMRISYAVFCLKKKTTQNSRY